MGNQAECTSFRFVGIAGQGGEGGVFDGQGQARGNLGDFLGFCVRNPGSCFAEIE